MKKLFIVLAFGVSALAASAQQGGDYKSAIGARIGTSYHDLFSASFKNFVTERSAFEINAGFGSRNYGYFGDDYRSFTIMAAATYQHHFRIPVEGLRWFIGGGITVASTSSKYDGPGDDHEGFGLGLYPTGGVDYKFSRIPLNVTADIRPTFFVTQPDHYNDFQGNFGVAVRYTFR